MFQSWAALWLFQEWTHLGFKMEKLINLVTWATGVITWLAGIVLAKGWLKLLAFLLPPYGWYLIVERTMQAFGIVGS